MSNNIVNVNVYQQVGSAPSTLQQTGAFISQGGTTLTAGTYGLLTQMSDLTALLTASNPITAIAWASNVVTVTLTNPHGVPSTDVFQGVISNTVPTGYNGTFQCTSTGANTFTYPLTTNPGSETTLGTFTIGAVSQLVAMYTTFLAQGSELAVYVLELGTGGTSQGVTALNTYIGTPHVTTGFNGVFYAYLLPTTWDAETTFPTMARNYDATTAKVYFFVETSTATYNNYATIKSVFANIPNASLPVTENSEASEFWTLLNISPSSTNMVSPFSYTFVNGVTVYNPGSLASTLNTAGVNWIGTGAEGQISNTLIQTGKFMDGNVVNYWYAIDWLNIQEEIALAAAIINGSNNPTNPLYYTQAGINALQKVAENVVNNGIAFGMIQPGAVVTAVPFATYIAQNPSNYQAGIYTGLAVTFTPLRGFASITIGLTASFVPN